MYVSFYSVEVITNIEQGRGVVKQGFKIFSSGCLLIKIPGEFTLRGG